MVLTAKGMTPCVNSASYRRSGNTNTPVRTVLPKTAFEEGHYSDLIVYNAPPAGLEPATLRLGNRWSLTFTFRFRISVPAFNRTLYNSRMLCQLSYRGISTLRQKFLLLIESITRFPCCQLHIKLSSNFPKLWALRRNRTLVICLRHRGNTTIR